MCGRGGYSYIPSPLSHTLGRYPLSILSSQITCVNKWKNKMNKSSSDGQQTANCQTTRLMLKPT